MFITIRPTFAGVRRDKFDARPAAHDPRHRGAQDGLQAVLRGVHL